MRAQISSSDAAPSASISAIRHALCNLIFALVDPHNRLAGGPMFLRSLDGISTFSRPAREACLAQSGGAEISCRPCITLRRLRMRWTISRCCVTRSNSSVRICVIRTSTGSEGTSMESPRLPEYPMSLLIDVFAGTKSMTLGRQPRYQG